MTLENFSNETVFCMYILFYVGKFILSSLFYSILTVKFSKFFQIMNKNIFSDSTSLAYFSDQISE